MKRPTASRWLLCLCVLPWLTACGVKSQPLTRTRLIDVPAKVYVPIPAALTAPLPEPAPPAAHCSLRDHPAVCVSDALAWIEQWRGVWRQANADRATAARLGTSATKESAPPDKGGATGATPHDR